MSTVRMEKVEPAGIYMIPIMYVVSYTTRDVILSDTEIDIRRHIAVYVRCMRSEEMFRRGRTGKEQQN
jgi:hypothetical protein